MKKLGFIVGKKYVFKDSKNDRVYTCEIDYHPWDRTKRLAYTTPKGTVYSLHISQFKRNLMKEVR